MGRSSMFKIKELVAGINSIQDFINYAAKKMPDKDVRGFTDHINYMQEILNRVLDVFKYFDDTWYNGRNI